MASVIINSRLSDCAVIEILYAFVSGPFHRLPHTGIGSFFVVGYFSVLRNRNYGSQLEYALGTLEIILL